MGARGALAALLAALALVAGCARGPELPPPSPALWEIRGPEGAHGWLFGTVHALPDGYDWRTPALDAAFAQADTLAVEADLEDASRAYFLKLATTPGLGRPSARVDSAHAGPLSAAFAEAGLSEDGFRDIESWAVALALAQAFAFGEGENGVDLALIEKAGSRRLVELEGYEEQLAIFDRLPTMEQIDMLEIVSEEARHAPQEGRRQALAWRAGDVAALERAMEGGLLADPELREALFSRRNRDWAGRIDALLRGGSAPFVAVGAAHMLGEDGLIALLEARGYRIRRIQ